jgi:monomeric sarcosine oxidase
MERFNVIILGAGLVGSAAAYKLAGKKKVLLLEQFEFLHKMGSSHGASRIFRHAYEDARYVRLAMAAEEAWRALEQDGDDYLLYRVGGLDIGRRDHPDLKAISAALKEAGSPYRWLPPEEVSRRFPAVRLEPEQVALYQDNAGILPATRCVAVMQRTAAARGAVLRERERVTRLDFHPGHVELATARGRYAADRLIVSAGPWLGTLLPELPLQVERQQVIYLRVRRPELFAPGALPIFILRDTFAYGFPLFDHPTAIKVGSHIGGRKIRVNERSDELDRALAERTIGDVRRVMPEVTEELADFQTCLYTKTPDEHFILDHHPEHDHVVIAGGFSGHGFKFGPLLGEIVAELAFEGKSRHDLSLFGIGRFSDKSRRGLD